MRGEWSSERKLLRAGVLRQRLPGAALGRRKESSHIQSEMSRDRVHFVILRFDDHSGMLSRQDE